MVIELPTSALLQQGGSSDIGLWATSQSFGVQTDRVGQGLISEMLIPSSMQSLYNTTGPSTDRANFLSSALTVLQNAPYNLAASQATTVADQLLPDMLVFNTSTAFTTNPLDNNGFPNGRRLRDDTVSYLLNLMTNGVVTTDNVPDDNGNRITDGTLNGSSLLPISFPYVGAANSTPQGPPS
jgi:hypothetical protein